MRLTNQIRDNIVNQETSRIFSKKETDLIQKLINLCEDKVKSTLPNIPKGLIEAGYFCTSNKVKVKTSGVRMIKKGSTSLKENRQTIRLDGGGDYVYLQNYYPIPKYNNYFCIDGVRDINGIILALYELRHKIYEFKKKMYTALGSVNTSKQLIDLLPELKGYVSDEKSSKALIPSEQIKDLRSIIRKKS
jgi:hypothetical protein